MIQRTFFLFLCGAAFWAGTEVQRALMDDRCFNAGGEPALNGVCRGVE